MLRSLGRDREATSGLLDRSTYGFLFRSHTIAFNPPSLDTGIPGTRTLLSGSVRNRTPSTSGLESDRLPQPHSQVLNLQRFKFVSRAAISPVSPAVHASDQKTPRDSTDFSGAQIWWSVSSWRAPYHIGVSLSSTVSFLDISVLYTCGRDQKRNGQHEVQSERTGPHEERHQSNDQANPQHDQSFGVSSHVATARFDKFHRTTAE